MVKITYIFAFNTLIFSTFKKVVRAGLEFSGFSNAALRNF